MIRLRSFWAKGFRSLRDVRLDELGPINVFYGPNGSGKSNVLLAMQRFVANVRRGLGGGGQDPSDAGYQFLPRDFRREQSEEIVLGGIIEVGMPSGVVSVDAELRTKYPGYVNGFHRLLINGEERQRPEQSRQWSAEEREQYGKVASALSRAFIRIDADRYLNVETDAEDPTARKDLGDDERARRSQRRVQTALHVARGSSDRRNRERVERLRKMLTEDLLRPRFTAVQDERTSERYIVEDAVVDGEVVDRRIEDAGYGVVQLYTTMIPIYLSGASMVAIEEPEAHLHGPTTGRMLRKALKAMVERGDVSQLFIATHSNLFDLDPTGYYDVTRDETTGATAISREPLERLEEQHLYEPGPMKRVLRVMLEKYRDDDRVMYLAKDGSPVRAAELIQHLDADDDIGLDYVRGLYTAAMELYGNRARRGER